MKAFLIRMRSRFSPKNTYHIERGANFDCKAIVQNSSISVQAGNTVRIPESARLRDLTIQVRGKNNRLIVHEHCLLTGTIELFGDGNHIEIGKHTHLTGTALIAHHGTKILIGENCLAATDTDIRTSDSHPIFDEEGNWINPDKDIIIHDRVWLARYVAVLKGSVIESDCVAGYKSLVSGHIPKNSICAGIPAKVVKQGITWQSERDPNLQNKQTN